MDWVAQLASLPRKPLACELARRVHIEDVVEEWREDNTEHGVNVMKSLALARFLLDEQQAAITRRENNIGDVTLSKFNIELIWEMLREVHSAIMRELGVE